MSEQTSKKVVISEIGETQEFGDNGFKKRQLIGLEINGEYENHYCFEFVQDKTNLLDNFEVGENVEVFFNIRCRKYEPIDKPAQYFTTLSGWKVKLAEKLESKPPF
jgi:hypothetical protein